MKRSSRFSRTPANLSESVHRQLNSYALAATAAGVGALALVAPAEAKIVYTPAHHVIGENRVYQLAVNHREPDFFISNKQCLGSKTDCGLASGYALLSIVGQGTHRNLVVGFRTNGSLSWASALKRGTRISKHQVFGPWGRMVGLVSHTSGQWNNVTNRYLGLKFKIDGKFHYGWARLNVEVARHPPSILVTLTGYAYETIPNKPIIAGQTRGSDEVDSDATTAVTLPAKPATLGALATGAHGLSIWRRKESGLEGN